MVVFALMALARTASELRRWSDLSAVRLVLAARMPELRESKVGLMQVAECCRRQIRAFPGRDCNETRAHLVTICCEWDLAADRLEDQSEDCLRCLATFLGVPPPFPG